MDNFDIIIGKIRNKEWSIEGINFCYHSSNGSWSAYIMGEGAEQLIAKKSGFTSKQEIFDLYTSLGIKFILSI